MRKTAETCLSLEHVPNSYARKGSASGFSIGGVALESIAAEVLSGVLSVLGMCSVVGW